MMSQEEFKALIEAKRLQYERRQKKIKQRAAMLLSATAVCVALIVFALPQFRAPQPDMDGFENAASVTDDALPILLEVTQDIAANMGQDQTDTVPESALSHRRYTDPDKIKQVFSQLQALYQVDLVADDATEETAVGFPIIVYVTDPDGSTHTYTLRGDNCLRLDEGEWRQLSLDAVVKFKELLNQLPTDEKG